MRGDARVLEMLNELLANELAAINTYFVDARLRANWGYPELAKRAYDESIDEMRHAQAVMDRIIYFDEVPNLQRMARVRAGGTVKEQFENQLDLERSTLAALVSGIAVTREVGDDGTRLVLEPMVADGERAIDWIETQLSLIESIGEVHYLAQHVRDD